MTISENVIEKHGKMKIKPITASIDAKRKVHGTVLFVTEDDQKIT